MKIKLRLLLLIFLWLGTGLLLFGERIEAQIAVNVEREFTLDLEGRMQVVERETLRNNFGDRFIPGGTARRYNLVISAQEEAERAEVAEAIYSSLDVKVSGQRVNISRINEGGSYGFDYQINRLNPGSTIPIEISYYHPELGARVGGLLDAYIPAFSEDFQFSNGNTDYTYSTILKIPEQAGTEGVISVEPTNQFSSGGFDIYEFSQDSLVGKYVWVQRGSTQVYKFTITQPLLPTTERANGDLNEYEVIIPRDIVELNIEQQIFFTEIKPGPVAINQDIDGNLVAIFQVPADERVDVVIAGYARLTLREKRDIDSAGTVADVEGSLEDAERYLAPAEFWEVSHPEIEARAEELVGDTADVTPIVQTVYRDVVDSIDYSQVKRFGLNERQGALRTLQGGAAVCMEYSDLYLTLLRNRGVPARAAFGYGYDSRLPEDEQEAHQWVQVFLPNEGKWIGVDVTWGETGNEVIGGDLNHFYTHVATVEPNNPPVLSRLSLAGAAGGDLEGPRFSIEALAEIPAGVEEESLTQAEVLELYPSRESDQVSFFTSSLLSKYTSTWANIFTEPARIDAQGWGMVIATAIVLLIMVRLLYSLISQIVKAYKEIPK